MERIGYVAIAVAAVLWAVGGTLARYLIEQGASVLELTEARAWIAVVGVGALVWLRHRGRTVPPQRVPWWLVVVFGLAIAAANFFYYASLSDLPVAVAITVQYTAPGLVVVWTVAAERSRPPRRLVGALVLALAGVALLAELPAVVAGDAGRVAWAGFAAAAASAVAFATYVIVGERVGRAYGSDRAMLRGFAVASVFWLAVQLTRGRPDTLFDTRFIPGIVILAVVTTIAPFLLFVWGLERVDASRAGIVSTLEPLAAALLAFLTLGETLSLPQLVGAVMVIGGIGIVQAERPESPEVLAERAAVE